MGHIYCMMGKSASGKDSLYAKLLNDEKAKTIKENILAFDDC